MRTVLKLYIALVAVGAVLLVAVDVSGALTREPTWSITLALALLMLCAAAEHITFQVHSGWATAAGTIPHMAAVFLLPPGVAALIGALGVISYDAGKRTPLPKVVFNAASVIVSIAAASYVASAFGGLQLITHDDGWLGPPVAVLATATYYLVSVSTVAGAVALDRRRPFWQIIEGKIGFKAVAEIGLGLLGATLAVVLTLAPAWAPALVLPASLLVLAKQAMDRGGLRSRNLALTSAVGRAVAGTLDPALAFQAVTTREVRDLLKLDGLALVPLGDPPAFEEHVACDSDLPLLRAVLAAQSAGTGRIEVGGGRSALPELLPPEIRDPRLAAAAIPLGAGSEKPVGVLVAWRSSRASRRTSFDSEEMLVLDTLADYAAVALETSRLAMEMARLSREAAEAEAMREVEALRAVARLKDEFLGQVSHELRTPLTYIHGYAELIAQGLLKNTDEVLRGVREIYSNSALMLRLVDDLLDTSQLESGRLQLKLEILDPVPWLARTTGAFAQAMPTHRVVPDLPETLPLVRVDPARLAQVMNNLLSNAARYSPPGSEIGIGARTVNAGRDIEMRVSDAGTGIPPEECERIFEKFYRGKNGQTQAVRGTGLGLAVARALIEAHHGHIGVESTVGKGSTFWLRLPTLVPGVSERNQERAALGAALDTALMEGRAPGRGYGTGQRPEPAPPARAGTVG